MAALAALHKWFSEQNAPAAGGLLVLPTGAGKTFTAVRFLVGGPLSDGWRVLWLAHTHHLLEQAFESLSRERGHVREPREHLAVKVVSGTIGHANVADIAPHDDVVITTLQTAVRAFKVGHPHLRDWLAAAGNRLIVVFDEAHHAPAYSYRTLLTNLRKQHPGMALLGLTATPVYNDERRIGWLTELFPQGILHQTTVNELMAASILAKPIFEEYHTNITVDFDERDYRTWLGTYRDLPDTIVTKLAENRDRNEQIASAYVKHRERYGKTLMFVDRWFQCEMLREMLLARGVKADVLYSHVTIDRSGPEARNRRTEDDNRAALERFRKGEVEVLINVRMLTEGTDVPDVNTVFLTRQTTSQILLTQMIGRALRGPAFGGTPQAYIVSFIDNWKHLINWAEYQLIEGEAATDPRLPVRRPPLHLISIALVRDLARMMDEGRLIEVRPYLTLLPVGWYRVEYVARVAGTDDLETIIQLVMVFEHERAAYQRLIAALDSMDLRAFGDEEADLAQLAPTIEQWCRDFFEVELNIGGDLAQNLFHIARHLAFHDGAEPAFFAFAERDQHDLDALAEAIIQRDLGPRAVQEALSTEYRRADRYWNVFYPSFLLFKSQYDACVNRILSGGAPYEPAPVVIAPAVDREPAQEVKDQVLRRDGYRCRSCGEDTRRLLQIDHVAPFYFGGDNSLGNLQTLCGVCNRHKNISEINFLNHTTTLGLAPPELPRLDLPSAAQLADISAWEKYLRRTLNFYYRCAAVEDVALADGRDSIWQVRLWAQNDPQWLAPLVGSLLDQIRACRAEGGVAGPRGLRITSPNLLPVEHVAPDRLSAQSQGAELWLVLGTATGELHERELNAMRVSARDQAGRSLFAGRRKVELTALSIGVAGQELIGISSFGKVYALPAVAGQERDSRTLSEPALRIGLAGDEILELLAAVPPDRSGRTALILMGDGAIKRMTLDEFLPATARGKQVAGGGYAVTGVTFVRDDDEVMVISYIGNAIRFRASDVPILGPSAMGVRAIALSGEDAAVALVSLTSTGPSSTLCVVGESGMSKRTALAEYRRQERGGVGVKTSSSGGLRTAFVAEDTDDLVAVTRSGLALRVRMSDIPRLGRATNGIYAIYINQGDVLLGALAVPAQ